MSARALAAAAALAAALAALHGPAAAEPLGADGAAAGETLVAARPIRARSVLGPEDVVAIPGATPGALSDPDEAIGMEARTMLGRGRPIGPGDLVPAAYVDRNQIVTMVFERGGLSITAEGRALARAGEGDRVRVMNLDSRTTVTGVAVAPGLVMVR